MLKHLKQQKCSKHFGTEWFARRDFKEGTSGLWEEPRNCFKHRSVKDLFNKGLSMLNCGSLQASQQLYKELIG